MSIDLPNPSNGPISQLGALETAKDYALLLHRKLARCDNEWADEEREFVVYPYHTLSRALTR